MNLMFMKLPQNYENNDLYVGGSGHIAGLG